MFNTLLGKKYPAAYQAPAWCKNPHLQTIWPRFFGLRKIVPVTMERIDTPDGDFVDLAWGPAPQETQAVIVLFHGLEGSKDSHYIQDMLQACIGQPWQVVLMHFRGCSGEPNRTHRAYHSGETADALWLSQELRKRYPTIPFCAVGYSLGGNMLLKLAGETKAENPFSMCVSVSAPLRLDECAKAIANGFAQVYPRKLLNSMRKMLRQKFALPDYQGKVRIDESQINNLDTFEKFDENITAPLHGFASANDYYQKCSGMQFLKSITVPTLVIHALDDPFMNEAVVPGEQALSPSVAYEYSRRGGHVGFAQGKPWSTSTWLGTRLVSFITEQLGVKP